MLTAVAGSAEPALVTGGSGCLAYANEAAVRTLGYDTFEELRGRPGHDAVHHTRVDGSPLPETECHIQLPLRTNHEIRHDEDWFVCRDGRMVPVSYRSVPVAVAGEHGMLVTFADAAELRRRRRQLRGYATVLAAIDQPVYIVDRDGITRYANPAALGALGYCDVSEIEGRDGHLLLHAGSCAGSRHARDDCPLAGAARSGEPVAVDEDWWVRADGSVVPLTYRVSPITLPDGDGVLVVFAPLPREREVAARATRRRILAAADDARRTLARDLHDGAQQRFVASVTTLQRARQACLGEAPHAVELIDLALEQAIEGIDELRDLAAGLHPRILEHHGLGAAVEALADRQPLPVKVSNNVEGRLPEGVESGVYFLVSEALTNIVKHAGASCAEARLACDGTALLVEINDDGVGGLSDAAVPASLADRVAALDGIIEVSSPPGLGTTVRAVVPVR